MSSSSEIAIDLVGHLPTTKLRQIADTAAEVVEGA